MGSLDYRYEFQPFFQNSGSTFQMNLRLRSRSVFGCGRRLFVSFIATMYDLQVSRVRDQLAEVKESPTPNYERSLETHRVCVAWRTAAVMPRSAF